MRVLEYTFRYVTFNLYLLEYGTCVSHGQLYSPEIIIVQVQNRQCKMARYDRKSCRRGEARDFSITGAILCYS